MKRFFILPVMLALASCAGTADTRATSALAIACDTYATALDQLTPRKASLSDTLKGRIDGANALVKPVCAKDAVIDPAVAVQTVQSGIALLNVIKGN